MKGRSLELAIEKTGMTVSEASNHLHIMEEYLMGIIDGTASASDEVRKKIREGLAPVCEVCGQEQVLLPSECDGVCCNCGYDKGVEL